MRKSRLKWLSWSAALFIVLLLGWLALSLSPSREPQFQGRDISLWLEDYAAHKQVPFDQALQATGTNALPYVVQELEKNESLWRLKYRQLWNKCPASLQKVLPAPKPQFEVVYGANAISYIGTNSLSPAIALLQHRSPTVRQAAAWGISALRRQSPTVNQAIPALTTALSDSEPQVRFNALLALKEMGADASNAVPAITAILSPAVTSSATNTSFYLRGAAALVLGKIGPAAASARPALEAAMQEPNAYLRGQAATALWRVSGDVDAALPVLLRELPAESEHSKWDWIIALGEMGPRAQAAIPQLKVELTQCKMDWVLEYVTNALRKIDPQNFPTPSSESKL